MPTRTGPSKSLLNFHVPVDEFEIIDGPRVDWEEVRQRLNRSNPIYPNFVFTLRTAASETSFKRRLSLASIFAVVGDTFSFTAIFSGKVVSGNFCMRTRTGWFTLE